jgi:hypothetical protein
MNDKGLAVTINAFSRITFLLHCLSSQFSSLRILNVTQNNRCWIRTNWTYIDDVGTVRLVSITLTILHALAFFRLLHKLWRLKELPYSYITHHICCGLLTLVLLQSAKTITIPCIIVHLYKFSVYQICFDSCFVILLLCVLEVNLSIRFNFAFLRTYTSFLLSHLQYGSRGPKELIQTFSPLTISFSTM